MNEVTIDSPAKINLALDVLGKMPNGYHEIQTIFQKIGLMDSVKVRIIKGESGISIACTALGVPSDEKNLAFKAAKIVLDKAVSDGKIAKIDFRTEISLEKKIPAVGGLGGGSSNAAATMTALNQLLELKYSKQEFIELGKNLGADVPFFFMDSTALGKGIGEKLTDLPSFSGQGVLLVLPKISYFKGENKTAKIYSLFDMEVGRGMIKPEHRPNIEAIVEALKQKNYECVAKECKNVFEPVVFKQYPVLKNLKNSLLKAGAAAAVMTGAGSVIFALTQDKKIADEVKEFGETVFTKTI